MTQRGHRLPFVSRRLFQWVSAHQHHMATVGRAYGVIVVWKDQREWKGQKHLFDTERCFFYITNNWTAPAEKIVREANGRCNQENTIAQGKNARVLSAPLDALLSNWAYVVIASLACSIKAWCALLAPVDETFPDKERQQKGEASHIDDGVHCIPQRVHEHSIADRSYGPAPGMPSLGLESLAGPAFPPGGLPANTLALLNGWLHEAGVRTLRYPP